MRKALVVLSGGQDSTTCAYWARGHFDEVHAITFDYNQTHALELEAARQIGQLVGVKSHEFLRLGKVLKSTSPLVDPAQPLETYSNYQEMDQIIGDRVEKTFVPMRNALFLVLAANHAVHLDCYTLITGVCQADNANYPDCRANFIHLMGITINEALGISGFRIETPLMDLSKSESICLMQDCGGFAALAFTHTAYDGRYPPTSKDHASVLRAHGFVEAGLPDPLALRAVTEGLMPLPATLNYSDPALNQRTVRDIRRLKDRLGIPWEDPALIDANLDALKKAGM